MYPRNAASPPAIAIGAIYLLADGTQVTAGASVRVKTGTGSWAAGGGTLTCDSTSGTWEYVPTQGETNAASFMVAVYKTGCTQATITVITTASDTAGYGGVDWGLVRQANAMVALANTSIASVSGSVGSVTGAVGSVTGNVGGSVASVTGAVGSVTGNVGGITGVTFPATVASPTNITAATGIVLAAQTHTGARIPNVTLVDTTTTNTDMRGTDNAALASNWTATRAGYLDSVLLAANSNRTVQVTGSNHVAADMHESQSGSIHTASFDAGALTDAVFASNAITAAKVAADVGEEIATAVRNELAIELARIDQTIGSRSTLTQADIRTATGMSSANLDSQLSAIKGETAAILDDTGASGVVVAPASKSGYALSSTGFDLVLVDGVAAPKALQIMAASVAGKVSGAGTSSEVFKGLDGLTTRMTVTADESGNRSNVVYVTT